MKKTGLILGIVIVIIGVFIFVYKPYYPSLPIENLSANQAIDSLKESDSKIAEIAVEGNYIWYITFIGNKGISIADENIKQLVVSNGWEFKEKVGAVYSLKKTIIA